MNSAVHATVNWHIPRPELAEAAYVHFNPGPAHALVIFERRRMGKTEFLREDFTPFAQERGWGVFYFSFMEEGGLAKKEPLPDFIRRLVSFAQSPLDAAAKKAGRVLSKAISKVSIAGGVVEISPAGSDGPLSTLGDVFDAIERRHGRAILILDEIQTLAVSSAERAELNKAFLGTLRTALDTHKLLVRAIFNGSSETRLRMMCDDSGASFFRYATEFRYELPGEAFARALLVKLLNNPKPMAGGAVCIRPDADRFTSLFMNEMGRCPYFARAVVDKLYGDPTLTPDMAWKLVIERERGAVASQWPKLTSVQRAILRFLAKGGLRPLGADALKYYGDTLGLPVPLPTAQSALRVLSSGADGAGSILIKRGRTYVFADEVFRQAIEADF